MKRIPCYAVDTESVDTPKYDLVRSLNTVDSYADFCAQCDKATRGPFVTVPDGSSETPLTDVGSGVSFLTLNVLFDRRKGELYLPDVTKPQLRYQYQRDFLAQHMYDIVCLNEVTKYWVAAFALDTRLNAHYYLSECVGGESLGRGGFGNLVLVRKGAVSEAPVFHRLLLGVNLARGVILASCRFAALYPGIPVTFCAAHLTAYPTNGAIRRREIQALVATVQPDVLLGDLNFHSEEENPNVPSGYVDVADGDRVATFNCAVNTMHARIWPQWVEEPLMRLDRVLLKPSSELRISGVAVVLDEQVADQLFPSDHFGLAGVLQKKPEGRL